MFDPSDYDVFTTLADQGIATKPELKYYEVLGVLADACREEAKAYRKRRTSMLRWVRRHLPGAPRNFATQVTTFGLTAIEYHGPVPEGFKRVGGNMIAPKESTTLTGMKAAKAWRRFGSPDFSPVLSSFATPGWMGAEFRAIKPEVRVLGERVFFVTLMKYHSGALRPITREEYYEAKRTSEEEGAVDDGKS